MGDPPLSLFLSEQIQSETDRPQQHSLHGKAFGARRSDLIVEEEHIAPGHFAQLDLVIRFETQRHWGSSFSSP